METTMDIQCPWCFEWVHVWIDPGSRGQMIRDCEVCCRPWELRVSRDEEGRLQIDVRRSN